MDFSKTKIYQRTRSCYEKVYMEFNKKKKSERIRNGNGDDDLIRESGGDWVNVDFDDDKSFRKNPKRKVYVEEVSGSGKNKKKFEINGSKRGSGENSKNHKRVARNDLQQNDEDDDALSYMGDNCKFSKRFGKNGSKSDHVSGKKIEKKLEKGFVNNTATSNGYISLDESEDDEGIIYLD